MYAHVSVLVHEAMRWLNPRPGGCYLDGTLGGGGHSEAILRASAPDGRLVGLDRDRDALQAARVRLAPFGARVILRQGSFSEARQVLDELAWEFFDGILLDLGVSSHQLDTAERGFSFRTRARLDMRMDQNQSLDARQLVNAASAEELARIFRDYGEEPAARRIAGRIVSARAARPIETTDELASLVESVKRRGARDHHPATQVFQALRIAVNSELEHLEKFLTDGYELLSPQGRLAIISFHSLEDRLVKSAFRKWSRSCLCPPRLMRCQCGWSQKAMVLTKKPVTATPEEMAANPRARSAKLRAVERV